MTKEIKEETRAVCPNCKSVNWQMVNVVNTTELKGIIQAECDDCGHPFEINVESSTSGWTHDALIVVDE